MRIDGAMFFEIYYENNDLEGINAKVTWGG